MGTILNPIITGFNPDPSICYFNEAYYLATSTFEYIPGITLYKSNDLVNFNLIGNILNSDVLDLNNCGHMSGVYAPSLRANNGIMYMITTNTSGQGHMFVTTKNPDDEKSWSKPIFVKGGGFDPDLFFDDNGKVYFIRENFENYGIVGCEIDIKTGKLKGKEKIIYEKFEDLKCEAPHIYKNDSYYYLLVAEGGTFRGHMVACARAKQPLGDYELCPFNPILTHRCEVTLPIQSCGHMDIIKAKNNNWYAYFLATRPCGNYHHLGRETFIAPLHFKDGWPHINYDKPITEIMNIPELPNRLTDMFIFKADFSKTLSPHFMFRRNPYDNTHLLENNKLKLLLEDFNLSDINHRSFIGIRQKNFNFSLKSKVCLNDNGRAGISAIISDKHHYDIFLEKDNQEYSVCLRKTCGDFSMIEQKHIIDKNELEIFITADKNYYYFYYEINKKIVMLGKGVTYLLSAEVSACFNGVVLGMFSEGKGGYAEFLSFEYLGEDKNLNE